MRELLDLLIPGIFALYVVFSGVAFLVGLTSSDYQCLQNTRLKMLFPTHKLACYLTEPI